MNKRYFCGVAALAITAHVGLVPTLAVAQSSSQSSSGSSASVETSSNANAGGGSANNQIYLDQRGADSGTFKNETRHSGDYTIRSAPAVQAPSMGSGHPCGLGGSIGLSIIGGGAAGGVTQVDEACLLAQMGQGEAALIMIAQRDPAACKALRQVGRINSASLCDGQERRDAERAASESAAAAQNPIATCERDSSGRVVRIVKKRGVTNEAARAYCG